MKVILILSIMTGLALGCNTFAGLPDILRGYAYSIVNTQVNQTHTDCYKDTDRLATKITAIYSAVANIGSLSLIEPMKLSNQLVVDLSNHMQSCSTITLIKQFSSRTSTMSGLFDMIFSFCYEVALNGKAYSTFINHLTEPGTPCILVGADIGTIISEMFSYKAPEEDRLKLVRNFDKFGNEY